ncbi:MAG: 2,4-didehydro-3-deoxy-L-rhamnonate hydrolase [Bradyrhizobium sp.]|nr:2,4-didehydro-3-deoxy-L-rhamnonate hydrolase [Bradyrhizobium sp.]
MHLCRFNDARVGLVDNGRVHDVSSLIDMSVPEPILAAIKAGRSFSAAELKRVPDYAVSDVALLPPVCAPRKILAAPDNYRAHAAEMQGDKDASFGRVPTPLDQAGLFLKAVSSLVGQSHGIVRRFPSRRTDYEVELVAIIGAEGSNVPRERALDLVAGYAIGLDITVRGPEDRSFRKSLDTYTVVGPWMTVAAKIPDPQALSMSLKLNGELKQQTGLDDMVTDVAGLISYASTFATLQPGDMIFTGTPSGVGPIKGGDVITAEIDAIGQMQVAVRDHS